MAAFSATYLSPAGATTVVLPRVILEIGKTDYDQLIALAEFHRQGSHVDDAVAWLRDREKPKGPIYCDHVPPEVETFRAAGWPAVNAEKDIDSGVAEVRKRLEADSQDRPSLLVSDRCEHLIQEFLRYKEDHVGKGHAVDHCLDALRYAVMSAGKADAYNERKKRQQKDE